MGSLFIQLFIQQVYTSTFENIDPNDWSCVSGSQMLFKMELDEV